jgi:hypothetical protein
MTEDNTNETFDSDLEHFIITILKGKKDDRVGQALNNGGIPLGKISLYSALMTRNT